LALLIVVVGGIGSPFGGMSMAWGQADQAMPVAGAENAGDGDASTASAPAEGGTLIDRQGQVSERFQRLEELLLRLAEVEATENPERASLLRRAAKQSRETFILDRMSSAADALRGAQFQKAIDDQKAASENLGSLLKLLLTEDRPQRIRDEKERITNWIKDLKRQERRQRGTRARTENGAELDALESEQQGILDQAEALQQEMEAENQAIETPSESSPQEGQESSAEDAGQPAAGEEKQGQENEPSEAEKKQAAEALKEAEKAAQEAAEKEAQAKQKLAEEKQKNEQAQQGQNAEKKAEAEQAEAAAEAAAEQAAAEKKQAEQELKAAQQAQSPSPPSESQPSEAGESSESQSAPSQPQTPQENAQQQLQKAMEQMKQAQKDLEEAKRDSAVEKQRQAEEEIRRAIDQLEKILRQLREEEMERELARLEARLRKMAQMQTAVLEKTRELAAMPVADRDRQTDLRAGNLATEEKQIVLEADRAMLLLREEGSSVAFPEVVQQIRGDMQTVADRLAQSKIDVVTQGIQEDVLAALEEMITALQKAQRDLEKQRQEQQQQQQQQQQGNGEQPLVAALAELKLIRTMQTRVKSTTERYDGILQNGGEAAPAEIAELLRNLAERQNRLYTITRDLVLKRNQ